MNKTIKLIFWQRITIGVLIFALAFTSAIACYKTSREEKVRMSADNWRRMTEASWQEEARDQDIMTDLIRQLKRYESKYGRLPSEDKDTVIVPQELYYPNYPGYDGDISRK